MNLPDCLMFTRDPAAEQSSWQSLPSELKAYILRKIPLSKLKLLLNLTSKSWQELLASPDAHCPILDWEQGCIVLAGTQLAAARSWLGPVRSLRLFSPQPQLEHSYILYSSDRVDRLSFRDLPRSLTQLALAQYSQLNSELAPLSLTTLFLRDCQLPEDSNNHLRNVRHLDLQQRMPLDCLLGSHKPALRSLRLDCALPVPPRKPEISRSLPLSPENLPNLERLQLQNVGDRKSVV